MTGTRAAEPAVTIGLPFLDCAGTLRETLQSIFAQTHTDWELLLVDDGSRDGSLEIAQAVDDARVRVVSDGSNRGLVHRLNQIADLARARHLCRMDADDLMHPRRVEAQLGFLEAHPDVATQPQRQLRHLQLCAANASRRPVCGLRQSVGEEAQISLVRRHSSWHAEHELHVVRRGEVPVRQQPA